VVSPDSSATVPSRFALPAAATILPSLLSSPLRGYEGADDKGGLNVAGLILAFSG